MPTRELPGIKETTSDFDGIEAEIMKIFRREIYLPILKALKVPRDRLENAPQDRLALALQTGRLRYERGRFWGKLDAGLSKALKAIGAEWDYEHQAFKLAKKALPPDILSAVATSESRFLTAMKAVDTQLGKLLPAEIAEKVNIAKFFDRTLYRIDQTFEEQVKAITVVPKLTPQTRAKVAADYTQDLQRYISDFSEREIGRLRKEISESTMEGNRYESVVGKIQASYGVSERKAKFLARQETALMMSSFKAARYQEAGSTHYRWQCVVGSPKHPVRPAHKALDGKVFSWDSPPITDDKGNRNHPGQDYNCRCVPRPIVKF